jgi:hypothetical protein
MLSPHSLAGLHNLHLASVWRGDEPPSTFGDWLDARWLAAGQNEPDAPPEAVRVLGGTGAGIRWYTMGEANFGFVVGRLRGCYVVARDDRLPQSPTRILNESIQPIRVPGAM